MSYVIVNTLLYAFHIFQDVTYVKFLIEDSSPNVLLTITCLIFIFADLKCPFALSCR